MDQPINPYAPPQVLEKPVARTPDRLSVARPYISAHGRTIAVLVTTGITICCNILLLISFAMQLSMIMAAQQGAGLDMATAQANDTRQQIVSSLVLLTALASLVSFLVWIYAAHANLPALNAGPLEFTAGWAVGWFFIPIANLVKPYQAVVEIWKGSDPAPLRGQMAMSTVLVGWWWGLRIIDAIAGRVFASVGGRGETLDELLTISWVAIVLIVTLDLPTQICQLLLVRRVQLAQDERYDFVVNQPQVAASSPAGNPFAAEG